MRALDVADLSLVINGNPHLRVSGRKVGIGVVQHFPPQEHLGSSCFLISVI